MNKRFFVTFQKEGIHKYPAAPEGVEFLQYPHRHMFHFYVTLQVRHDDREVEFILFKRELENLYTEHALELDNQSCEMMAEGLINYIEDNYPKRAVKVEVYEDNENGAVVHNDLFNRP